MTASIKPIDVVKDVTQNGKHYTNHVMIGDGFTLGVSLPHPDDFAEWARAVSDSVGTIALVAKPSDPGLKSVTVRRWAANNFSEQYVVRSYAQYYERLTQLSASYPSVRVTQASHVAKMATCVARMLNLIEETRKVDQLMYKEAGLGDAEGLPL